MNPTIERVHGVNAGGYRITDVIDGYYVSKLYLGYSKKDALAQFMNYVKTITR